MIRPNLPARVFLWSTIKMYQNDTGPTRPVAYRRHNCERKHRTWRTHAECIWPRAEWISGSGQFASVSYCPSGGRRICLTISLHTTLTDATDAKRNIDTWGCGGQCNGNHRVVRLEGVGL